MSNPATWKGVLARYDSCPSDVRKYFGDLPALIKDFPWEVSISYQFGRVELAHHMALYCGVVKLHRVDATLARTAVERRHITRDGFKALFETIYGKPLTKAISGRLAEAAAIRDRVLHGKSTTPKDLRKAVVDVLDYANGFNDFVYGLAGLRPFGQLKGFKGRAASLEKSTSRWVLRGVGFDGF